MKQSQPDYILIFTILALILIGFVVLASASTVISNELFGESYHFLKHQLFYALPLGLLALFVAQYFSYNHWRKMAPIFLIGSIILLVMVFIPDFGYVHGGARRWLKIGSFSIQPFEFAKLAVVLYLAAILSKKGKEEEVIKQSLFPALVILTVISVLLLLQPDTSSLLILIAILFLLYFLAGIKLRYIFTSIPLLIIGFFVLIKLEPYRMNRVLAFLNPEIDPQGIGYQINQALIAIGSGGITGLGLGDSIQKWKYLPEPIGDSIFAIAAEELGFIGGFIIISLFLVLVWRGMKIAKNSPDKFSYLLAGGITGWIFLQMFLNIAAISSLCPLTGTPLPFISYGGSALIVSLASVGILINISKFTKI